MVLKEKLNKNIEDCNNELKIGLSEIFNDFKNNDMDYDNYDN